MNNIVCFEMTKKELIDSECFNELPDDAEIVFHQKVASGMTAIKNGTLKSALNLVINDMGGTELSDYKEKKEAHK